MTRAARAAAVIAVVIMSAALAMSARAAVDAWVVTSMYHLAGGSSIYDSSPLQRRLRDVHVATQHMMIAPRTWELAGSVLLGEATDVSQL